MADSTGRILKLLIIDDSATVRQAFTRILQDVAGLDIQIAADPVFALAKMESRWPDVIICDIEMPRMDGLTFLKKIMAERPTPVVICSTRVESGSQPALEALSLGAVDLIAKPKFSVGDTLFRDAEGILQIIRAAAGARIQARRPSAPVEPIRRVARPPSASPRAADGIIAIGASTGGTTALEDVLRDLEGAEIPAIVIVQHMPEKFTSAFAQRLNKLLTREICEAADGDRIVAGQVYLAPGAKHMRLNRDAQGLFLDVRPGPAVNYHCPSVDVLFRSVARVMNRAAVGVILTGMGNDGTAGMQDMRAAGAINIAQDEASSVVWGMPGEAVAAGCVHTILPLSEMAAGICDACVEIGISKS